jgi:hypothetical protein
MNEIRQLLVALLLVAWLLGGRAVIAAEKSPPKRQPQKKNGLVTASVPPMLQSLLKQAGLDKERRISRTEYKPFYLAGDFDADGKGDFMCHLERVPHPSAEVGADTEAPEEILPSEDRMVVFFGDGKVRYPEKEANFPGGEWKLAKRGTKIKRSFWEEEPPPKLKGDAVWMIKPDSSMALLYWTGKQFASYFVSD